MRIRVLVVDDDNLVRRGLISAMPWNRYDMEVVGEASNGEAALAFMASNPVDLLMTDLAMPVMSGIELMRETRERFPRVHMIVLTLHQDFEYVQDALRLGAIDYIAKIQLERERFDDVLGRIHNRIMRERGKAAGASAEASGTEVATEYAYMLLCSSEYADSGWMRDLDPNGEWTELDGSSWLWLPSERPELEQDEWARIVGSHPGWMIARIQGIGGKERSEVHRVLRRNGFKHFFYAEQRDGRMMAERLDAIREAPPVASDEASAALRSEWLTFAWMRDDVLLGELLGKLKALRLSVPRLSRLMLEIVSEWNKVYGSAVTREASVPETIVHWRQCADWFAQLKETAAPLVGSPYSKEVAHCIMAAVRIVQEELSQSVYAVDVAKRVNMSRSYFNQCFKDIVGRPFNEFVQHVRIEKAKEYLLRTNRPVQWIAEQIGYADEKYFSRLFREQTGCTPSEFRRQGGT